jgi:hypothetical protein
MMVKPIRRPDHGGFDRALAPPQATGHSEPAAQRDVAFMPLAMPSLAGPGSIAVVIGMSSTAQAENYVILRHALIAVGIVGIALTALFCYVVLRRASGLAKRLGRSGKSASTGIMGFLLVCIGVQFIINGVAQLTGAYLRVEVADDSRQRDGPNGSTSAAQLTTMRRSTGGSPRTSCDLTIRNRAPSAATL